MFCWVLDILLVLVRLLVMVLSCSDCVVMLEFVVLKILNIDMVIIW